MESLFPIDYSDWQVPACLSGQQLQKVLCHLSYDWGMQSVFRTNKPVGNSSLCELCVGSISSALSLNLNQTTLSGGKTVTLFWTVDTKEKEFWHAWSISTKKNVQQLLLLYTERWNKYVTEMVLHRCNITDLFTQCQEHNSGDNFFWYLQVCFYLQWYVSITEHLHGMI